MYNLLMDKKAKLIFKHNSFDIIEQGDYVYAISEKNIIEGFKLLERGFTRSLLFTIGSKRKT